MKAFICITSFQPLNMITKLPHPTDSLCRKQMVCILMLNVFIENKGNFSPKYYVQCSSSGTIEGTFKTLSINFNVLKCWYWIWLLLFQLKSNIRIRNAVFFVELKWNNVKCKLLARELLPKWVLINRIWAANWQLYWKGICHDFEKFRASHSWTLTWHCYVNKVRVYFKILSLCTVWKKPPDRNANGESFLMSM